MSTKPGQSHSVRYGLMVEAAAEEARTFLDLLEQGYTLRFTRSGLVFDFDKPGTEPPEREVGIEFHRIGSDLIRALVEQAASTPSMTTSTEGGGEGDAGPTPAEGVPPGAPAVPQLDAAAFLVAERQRVTTVDQQRRENNPSPPKTGAIVEEPAAPACLSPSPVEASLMQAETEPAQDPMPPRTRRKIGTDGAPSRAEENDRAADEEPTHDIILGATQRSPQFGLLGEAVGRKVALDLNQTHTISLFGVQGGGKSYTLGSIIEMACMPIPGVNVLPRPVAAVVFHYSSTLDYKPEFTSMVAPNTDDAQGRALRDRFGARPRALEDVVILSPAAKVAERTAEYPAVRVLPISFKSSELKAAHWKFLMGAVGSQSIYIRQVGLIMKKLRDELTLAGLQKGIEASGLSDHLKELALLRLRFAEEYINDQHDLTKILRPGRLVIVDLRDELVEKDEALGLFVVLLQMFAETTHEGRPFNKLVVFDEAHKYIHSPDLVAGLIEVVREMRHKGTSILVASQDPPSVPASLIELSSQIILHKFNSPSWLKHIQKANAALESLTPAKLAALGPGEAYVWSSKATDDAFTRDAIKIWCRPRVTQHGGATKTAVAQQEHRGK